MASPIPKPTALKVLEGNPGKRALPNNPHFAPLSDEGPEWFDDEASAEWLRIVGEFSRIPGLAQRTDRTLLIAWCAEHSNYIAACKERMKSTDSKAKKRAHQQARESLEKLIQLAARFGLSPADRSKIDLPRGEDEDDPFLHLLSEAR